MGMEDLVKYSLLDRDAFDRLAQLDITMLFISQLMESGRNDQALGLLRKVVHIRNLKSICVAKKEQAKTFYWLRERAKD